MGQIFLLRYGLLELDLRGQYELLDERESTRGMSVMRQRLTIAELGLVNAHS